MASFRIRVKVEGDTLVLPELKLLVGKTVDIEVIESLDQEPAVDRWVIAAKAVSELTDYDFDAWAEQRALDRQRGQEHLP